jgi:hypothetical protein
MMELVTFCRKHEKMENPAGTVFESVKPEWSTMPLYSQMRAELIQQKKYFLHYLDARGPG